MAKYLVSGHTDFSYYWEVEVEAEDREDAEEIAKQLAVEGEAQSTYQDPIGDWVDSVEEL